MTFEEQDGKTTLRMHEIFPSEAAFEANGGMENALPETFGQLDEVLGALGARVLGRDAGSVQIPEDFDAPLPGDVLELS